MTKSLSVIALTLLLNAGFTTWAKAADETRATETTNAETAGSNDDCSKQVWPQISTSCLRTSGDKVNARMITLSRQQ